ncbi:hypothetical protein SLA2020_343860 [Shorea laevis]
MQKMSISTLNLQYALNNIRFEQRWLEAETERQQIGMLKILKSISSRLLETELPADHKWRQILDHLTIVKQKPHLSRPCCMQSIMFVLTFYRIVCTWLGMPRIFVF